MKTRILTYILTGVVGMMAIIFSGRAMILIWCDG